MKLNGAEMGGTNLFSTKHAKEIKLHKSSFEFPEKAFNKNTLLVILLLEIKQYKQ